MDKSSICRAGIHNQVINDDGGLMIVSEEDGKSDYFSSTSNGVESFEFFELASKSFVVNSFKAWCPMDDF